MMEKLKNNIDTALGNKKADVVLKNAFIVNVFSQSIEKDDIAINGDTIVGIGQYSGKKEIDCTGHFVSPGFIDSHVHIESSKVTPEIFSHILIKKGVTTCVADPHEIANVMGEAGIKFMTDNGKKSVIDIFYMLPSCVPAVEFEDNGAILNSEELAHFINNDRVLGLGEVMDVQAVVRRDKDMLSKICLFKDKIIDGHCPQISNSWLNAYMNCGISTDHECTTPDQALEKIKKGMYVMLRQGSAARNLKDLLPAVNNDNFHRFLFCTDDKDIVELEEKGSIDDCIRIAVEQGLDPIKAITIATLNAAQCYGLKRKGAIAPGYKADLVILENLKNIKSKHVIKSGKLYIKEVNNYCNVTITPSMNIECIKEDVFKIKAKFNKVNVIKVIPDSIETKKEIRKASIKNDYVEKVASSDVLKIAVFERHKRTGKYSVGFIEGLGIKDCAIAQTIAHDSHNIIVVGSNDKDMEVAVNSIITMGGGVAIVSGGKLIEQLSLPIGGLMTFKETQYVIDKMKRLNVICKQYGMEKDKDIFLTLGFMALPVIPEIRITARGLFDFNENKVIELFC
ncbi:adenine deaminase [Clostridium ganghwense]|uniref:Adenine deaminase n=1 Tax=Clostridium ganghwense TaxID=312089 RepID=A0ABT4CJJ7_9CLOT|nr:adenine deaminase [Clostridium ganghwense]MCY6369229.1 adenine deaminase [Clostridium ganghwense]